MLRGLLSGDDVSEMRSITHRALAQYDVRDSLADFPFLENVLSCLIINAWQNYEEMARISLAPKFASVAAALLGVERVRLYSDEITFKGPGMQESFWHQDSCGAPLPGESIVTCWIPLMKVTPEMGSIRFVNRSQRFGNVELVDFKGPNQHRFFESFIRDQELIVSNNLSYELGDVSFHHGFTVRSAGANQTDVMREAIALTFVADGAEILQPRNEPQMMEMFQILRGLVPGNAVAGPGHPLVYPPSQ